MPLPSAVIRSSRETAASIAFQSNVRDGRETPLVADWNRTRTYRHGESESRATALGGCIEVSLALPAEKLAARRPAPHSRIDHEVGPPDTGIAPP